MVTSISLQQGSALGPSPNIRSHQHGCFQGWMGWPLGSSKGLGDLVPSVSVLSHQSTGVDGSRSVSQEASSSQGITHPPGDGQSDSRSVHQERGS